MAVNKLSSTIRKFSVGIFLTLFFSDVNSQSRSASSDPTFFDVKNYFETKCDKKAFNDDGEWNQYKRWESFWEQRTFPSGEFPSPDILFNENEKLKSAKGESTASANWTFMGPHVVPTNGGGAGRLNCMAFDPNNSNIIWVGAACGGLWKSTDGGQTWNVSGTDFLPSLSISDIAIDPANSQIMYLATGDKYGISPNYFTKGQYSAGVLKSTDGGMTWNQTGLNYQFNNGILIQRLIVSHTNSQILYAACRNGMYQTTDGGATWWNIKNGKFYDVEMHPANANILYAADSAKIYLTTDGGANWSQQFNASGRSSIAVSKNFPNTVYVWVSGSLYYSANSGASFSFRQDPTNACNAMGYYDMVLEASPADENVLLAGGVNLALSTDGGTNWTTFTTPGTVHADQKAFMFLPNSSTTAFFCNDGGIFKTTDQCNTFSDLSNGLDIKQYYRMSSSFQNPQMVVAGAQDNGTDKITGPSTASMILWFDGEDCLVDYTNDNIIFASTQGGSFKRSTNGGVSFTNVPASGCYWTSPIVMDPNNHNKIYIGSGYIHYSSNNGVSWSTFIDTIFDGSCMYALEACKANSNYIYASTFGHIYRTTNGGTSWSDITGALPVSSSAISGITTSDTDPDKVWVSFSGFSQANKIYFSNDGGASWTNISAGIPNVPVNCIKYQNGSNDFVYAGADLGVFFYNTTSSSWVPFNTGLPNTIVLDLEMYYPTNKIRCATYGRGIWESDLQDSTSTTGIENGYDNLSVNIYPNPSDGEFTITYSGLTGINPSMQPLMEIYNTLGERIFSRPVSSSSEKFNASSLESGIYFLAIGTGDKNIRKKITIIK